jgi:hypothetical protein
MLARESWSLKEFTDEALKQIGYAGEIVIIPLGILDVQWAVRAGHTDEIREKAKLNITVFDYDGKKHRLKIEGDKTAFDIEEIFRAKWHLERWIRITVTRRDGEPFFMEEGGNYIITTQNDPDEDPRPLISVRIDT